MDEPIKCPKCGSTQITANKKGFSGTKAAAGVIIAGGIGIAAGDIGSNKIVITCLKCGYQFKPGSQTSQKQGPITLGGFIFISFIILGIFIPICGGSWWFLLIMPILGFIFALLYSSTKKNNNDNILDSHKLNKFSKNIASPHISNLTIGKQKIICSSCNGLNDTHFKYCHTCGEELDITIMETTKNGQSFEYEKCNNCHKLTPKKSNKCKFCVNCGFKL